MKTTNQDGATEFRGGTARLLIPGLATLIVVAVLVGLGLWQLQRKAEKETLIAVLGERAAQAPGPLPPRSEWNGLSATHDEFRRVRLTATFRESDQALVYGSGSALRRDVSGPGYWVFAAAVLPTGESVVINRGFVSEGRQSEIARGAAGPLQLTGVMRFPESPGLLTPGQDRARRLWFARDVPAMAQELRWGPTAPFYIDLESPVPPGGLPSPGPVQVQLRNEHLQYSFTWFGLAAVVLVSFAVWVRQQSRSANRG